MAVNESGLQVIDLKKYDQGQFNVLIPTTHVQQISPFHRMRIEEVRINPDPDAGEVFKVGSKRVGDRWEDVVTLGKPAILKLANAAGIVWNWNETKVLSASRDYVLYQAVAAIRKTSGEWIPVKCTKEIDITVIEEELMESNLKKARSMDKKQLKGMMAEDWAEEQTKSNLIQWRKNKLMRAETAAMLRVVRALLNLKMQYSPRELSKPFVVPRVDFSPDYTDPEVRSLLLQHGARAMGDLFGQAAGQAAGLPAGEAMERPFQEAKRVAAHIEDAAFDEYVVEDEISEDDVPFVPGNEDITEPDMDEPMREPGMDEDEDFDLNVCAKCGADVTEKVRDFSLKKFGTVYCYKCQKAEGGGH